MRTPRRSIGKSSENAVKSTGATSRACTCRASSSWRRCSRRRAAGAEKGNLEGAKQYRNCQFFTPETERSTHFFWDYLHDYDLQDPTIAQSLNNSMVEGFLEDKFIIEGQQEVLDADPDFKMNGIVADAPLAHFRRTLVQDDRR